MANLSPEDIAAIKQSANRLGLDPYSFGAIIQQESGFRPNVWGGTDGKYYGLIQFGGPERKEAGLDPEKIAQGSYTIPEQLPAVERWLRGRGFETGMSPQKAYATILGGNPEANIYAEDSFGTTVANTTQKLLPGGELYEYSKQLLGPNEAISTQTFGVSEPVPATDPATTTQTPSPPRKSVDEVLTEAGYDPENFKRVDNAATSLRDRFVDQIKSQALMQLLGNPLGGLF